MTPLSEASCDDCKGLASAFREFCLTDWNADDEEGVCKYASDALRASAEDDDDCDGSLASPSDSPRAMEAASRVEGGSVGGGDHSAGQTASCDSSIRESLKQRVPLCSVSAPSQNEISRDGKLIHSSMPYERDKKPAW